MEEYIKFYDNYERISELIWAIIPDIKNRFKFPIRMEDRKKAIHEFLNILIMRFPMVKDELEQQRECLNSNGLLVNCILIVEQVYGESKNLEDFNDKIVKSIQQVKNALLECKTIYDIRTKSGYEEMKKEILREMIMIVILCNNFSNYFPIESSILISLMKHLSSNGTTDYSESYECLSFIEFKHYIYGNKFLEIILGEEVYTNLKNKYLLDTAQKLNINLNRDLKDSFCEEGRFKI